MSLSGTSRFPVLTVMLFLIAALLLRAWLQTILADSGVPQIVAADLSYLVVPPLLFILLLPLLRSRRDSIADLFRRNTFTLSVGLYALATGVLLRIADWCQLIAGVALGFYIDPLAPAHTQPSFAFACPGATLVLLATLVTVILMPLVEEFVNRGLIQSALARRGALVAIPVASLLFALCHRPGSWVFAFLAGLVLGTLFWKTRTLWPSMIAHATVNGLIVVDWRCLQGQWNPAVESLPLWQVAVPSLTGLTLAIGGIILVLWKKIPGSMQLPGAEQITERLRPVQ